MLLFKKKHKYNRKNNKFYFISQLLSKYENFSDLHYLKKHLFDKIAFQNELNLDSKNT